MPESGRARETPAGAGSRQVRRRIPSRWLIKAATFLLATCLALPTATGATAAASLAAPLFQLPYTWWNPSWQFARVITVSTFANSPIDGYAGYTVRLDLDTTDGTRFLPNCDDLRIVYWNGATNIPLDRVVSNCGTPATEVWFRLQATIAANSSDSNYVLYYGNPFAGVPPADPRQVYLWWDDFNRPDTADITTELAYSKTGGGIWSIISGQLRNVGAAGDPNKLLIDALGATVADVHMQTRITVTSWAGDSDLGRMGLSCCMVSNGEGYAGLFHQDNTSLDLLNDLRSWGTNGTYSWSVGSWYNMAFRVIRPANRLGQIKVWPAGGPEPGSWTVDGNFGGGAARINGYVGLGGSRQADITLFDDLFIRKIVDPEPALGLSIEHSLGEQNPALSLTKAIGSGDPYSSVGGTINYSYAVQNSGDVSLPGPVTVTDDKATATCPAVATVGNLDTNLDPGESLNCTASHTVTQADLDAGSVINTATASAGGTTSNSSSRTATASQSPALTIAKSALPATYSSVGQVISYSYIVTNSGNVTLSGPFAVADNRATDEACPATASLAPGASISCTASYTITQADLDAGSVTNTATASGRFGASSVTSPPDSQTVTAVQSPALAVVKTALPATYSAVGDVIGYSYLVTNTGNVTLSGPFVVADNRATDEACPATASLAPGASITCSASYTIVQSDLDAGFVTNSATASGRFGGNPVTSPLDSETVTAVQSPALSIVKTALPATYGSVGQVISYSYQVTNSGNVTVSGPFVVADNRATDEACPATASLAPGASIMCSASYTILQSDLDVGSVTNTATASGRFGGNPITSPTDTETVTAVQSPGLSIVKTALPATYNAVGQLINYSFLVTNSGNVTVSGPFTVSDDHATDGSCPATASLAPLAFITCTASYTITLADLDAGSVTNVASAANGTVTSPTDTETVTAVQSPALAIVKTATPATYDSIGDVIGYSFYVTNSGNVTLSGPFTVSDNRATDEACPATPTLAPTASITCTASYMITQADLDAGSVTNTATATNGNVTSPPDSETVTATQATGLTLTKSITSGSPYYSVGDVIQYSYDVENTGNVTLDGPFAVLDDRSTNETCPATLSLAPGASITCAASYTVTAPDLTAGSVTNSAYATGLFSSSPVTSNTDQATAVAVSDPAVTKTANPATAQVGDTVTFTLVVTNNGPGSADNVNLTDPIPAFLDISNVTVVPAGPLVSIVGNTVTVSIGTLTPAQTYTVTITTIVNSLGAPPGGTNSVSVTTTSGDADPANNASSALVTIVVVSGLPAPATGFAPGRTTILPTQPDGSGYSRYSDLWIEIPALGATMPIVGVPLTEDGWDVTWLGGQAGYLNGTAFPTWEGNSVITAHVALASGRPGPFRNLKNLRWDNTIVVHYAGQRYVYSVRRTASVRPDDASIFRHEERAWLTLVTCQEYDAAKDAYRMRTLVRAVLTAIEPEP